MVGKVVRIGVFALMGVVAVGLLAFGPRAGDRLPQGRVVVDYWEVWTGTEGRAIQSVVDDFNATVGRDKGIYVRFLSTSGVVQKTLIATAAGVPPDIAGLSSPNVPQFAAQNALEPLDALAAAHGLGADHYKKVCWDACRYDGQLFALPSAMFDIGLYYNTDLIAAAADRIRAAGLDPDRPPATLDELDRLAAAVDRRDARGHIEVAGYLPMEPGWFVNATPLWFGGDWWDEAHHRFTFTDPRVVAAFRWVQGYSKRLGPDAVSEFQAGVGNFDSPTNAFFSGTVAAEQQGTYFASFIAHNKPSLTGHWAAAPFPAAVPGLVDVTLCSTDLVVIPRGAKHKAEAFEFMAFLSRQAEAEKLAAGHGKPSPLARVSDGFFDHHPNPYIRLFDRLAASPNAHGTPPVPILAEVVDEMNAFTQQLVLMQVTPEAGLARVQDKMQKAYANFMADQRSRHARP